MRRMRAYRPLAGLRVLAFEVAVTLPSATRLLADLGADVVGVRPPRRPGENTVAVMDGTWINKRSLSLDLDSEAGRDLAWRLAEQADIVCNNFTPRVMRRAGLAPEEMCARLPSLIVLQLSGYGSGGPWEDFQCFGPSAEAAGAMNSLIGRSEDPPGRVGSGVFADQLVGRYAAVALLGALEQRRATGRGQVIDLAMFEAIAHVMGEHIAASTARGEPAPRRGNRSQDRAPQGIYPARGEDGWLAISVETVEEWQALATLLGDPALARPELDSLAGRIAAHDEIDTVITAWSAERDRHEAAAALQAAGVPATPVTQPQDLALDGHYAARGVFGRVSHRRGLWGMRAHPVLHQTPRVGGGRPPPPRAPPPPDWHARSEQALLRPAGAGPGLP
jgi:crotonobetainyl-CoA:carnitine CoA-transferase CaiB-like acyl-CoA transferase